MTLIGYNLTFQTICDADCRVSNLEAKWPGSVHDSIVFRASSIYECVSQRKSHILFVL